MDRSSDNLSWDEAAEATIFSLKTGTVDLNTLSPVKSSI